MIVQSRTSLKIPATAAWGLLKQRDTFLFITRGAMRYRGANAWPETLMEEGVEIDTVVHLLGFLPGCPHTFRIVRVDEVAREVDTEESGGFVRGWKHSMKVEEAGDKSSVYHDRVELRAGILTPIVWLIASVFYRYRQHRWRSLVSRIADDSGASSPRSRSQCPGQAINPSSSQNLNERPTCNSRGMDENTPDRTRS